MTTLRIIFHDQLSPSISSLSGYQELDTVLMLESWQQMTYVKHHKKKIALILSAMRHFHEWLKENNYNVHYIQIDPDQKIEYREAIKSLQKQDQFEKIVVTHPGEHHLLEEVKTWQSLFKTPVDIREDTRFLCKTDTFRKWAEGKSQLRMENFYRKMRTEHDILMVGKQPVGNQWNYDSDNRKPPPKELKIPKTYMAKPDQITESVLKIVEQYFSEHFGDLMPFHFAVNHAQAMKALDDFIDNRLIKFGDYQDAMIENEPWMYHSHLAFYLNIGLLLPIDCIKKAEEAYHKHKALINAVEGFIRQILGWREYIRGIYWLKMPQYVEKNFLDAQENLPQFYWTADTNMNCLKQAITETKQNAYAHHIQRLMVLGNFALLLGIHPDEVNEWFLIVYADAHQWVELPNVSGMILFADGGYLASKPYAAGGAYINKMSNYCKNCVYNVLEKNGPKACPFNYLYWDFLARNREKLATNPRIGMMYRTYDRMSEEKKKAIREDSNNIRKKIYNQ